MGGRRPPCYQNPCFCLRQSYSRDFAIVPPMTRRTVCHLPSEVEEVETSDGVAPPLPLLLTHVLRVAGFCTSPRRSQGPPRDSSTGGNLQRLSSAV